MQLGKIPSSIANKEIKKGETTLLGPGGMICIWQQQYPHFVYFKENLSIKNTPLKRTYTSDASENTLSDLFDKHIVKKRKMEECDNGEGYDKNDASYSANDVDLESKDEIDPVRKKSPSKCIDAEEIKKNVDGTKEIEDKCMNRKRKMERSDTHDNNDNHHKTAKKAKMSSDDSKDLNINDKQDMQSVCEDDDDDDEDDHHDMAKKAKMSSDDSIKDLNVIDEQDSKLACKDSKEVDSSKRTLATGSPCTTSTWEEIAQELLIYTRQGIEGRSKVRVEGSIAVYIVHSSNITL